MPPNKEEGKETRSPGKRLRVWVTVPNIQQQCHTKTPNPRESKQRTHAKILGLSKQTSSCQCITTNAEARPEAGSREDSTNYINKSGWHF